MKRNLYWMGNLFAVALAGVLLSSQSASAAQIHNEIAWVRTPSATTSSTFTDMTCETCQWATPKTRWRLASTGLYSVVFPSKAHAADEPAMFHATAFGKPGAACRASDGGIIGRDQYVSVSCLDANRDPVNSRFELYFELEPRAGLMDPSGGGDPHGKRAFATVFNSQLMPNQFYNPAGPTPVVTRVAVGRFKVFFPGFMDFSSGGNALVTPLYPTNQCALAGWEPAGDAQGNAIGSNAYVVCRSWGVYADAAFTLSMTYFGGLRIGALGSGFILADLPSDVPTYTPSPWYNIQSAGDTPATYGEMSVTHNGPGDYSVIPIPGGPFSDSVGALVSPYNLSAVCGTTAVDRYSARIFCSVPGSTTGIDGPFSMELGSVNQFPFHKSFKQVTFQNFGPNAFDVGYGLWCAQEITGSGRVECGTPANLEGAFYLPHFSVPTKGVAIWNIDRAETIIYLLSTNDNTYVFNGNLSKPFGTSTNFASSAYTVKPILKNTNQVIGINRIVAVSGFANMLVGLTGGNQLVEVTGTVGNAQWLNLVTLKNLPTGVTAKDISHGPDGLYVLTTANTIYRLTKTAATLLPALPNGLQPIVVGGPYAITNAGKRADGSVLCTSPYDSSRDAYTCPGDDQRFYYFAGDGSWHAMNPGLKLPTEDDPKMSNSINPFASSGGAVVDARAFDGNTSEIWAWQIFSRLYRFVE
jgi:hypothetical protein